MAAQWYIIVVTALGAGTFLGLWLTEMTLRREWKRIHQAQKNVNEDLRELEERWEEWRQLQEELILKLRNSK